MTEASQDILKGNIETAITTHCDEELSLIREVIEKELELSGKPRSDWMNIICQIVGDEKAKKLGSRMVFT